MKIIYRYDINISKCERCGRAIPSCVIICKECAEREGYKLVSDEFGRLKQEKIENI